MNIYMYEEHALNTYCVHALYQIIVMYSLDKQFL